ncbi:recombinase family protein [Nocardiopsis sp. L17-MgMaSL7]|uniref:recombinase family protein n=1 Tax=Nocardiopsis sp. L17-MgMaSL7 TaxID=1938893 RepID=UPI001F3F52B2
MHSGDGHHPRTPRRPLTPAPGSGGGGLIGYARVSTREQKPDRQLRALETAGCAKVFADKKSGKNAQRPELKACLARPGRVHSRTHRGGHPRGPGRRPRRGQTPGPPPAMTPEQIRHARDLLERPDIPSPPSPACSASAGRPCTSTCRSCPAAAPLWPSAVERGRHRPGVLQPTVVAEGAPVGERPGPAPKREIGAAAEVGILQTDGHGRYHP